MAALKAPTNDPDEEGRTPLKIAEENSNWNAAKMLLRQGALPDDTVQANKLKELFSTSLFQGIDVPIAGLNGARMWDIIENFARQCKCFQISYLLWRFCFAFFFPDFQLARGILIRAVFFITSSL